MIATIDFAALLRDHILSLAFAAAEDRVNESKRDVAKGRGRTDG